MAWVKQLEPKARHEIARTPWWFHPPLPSPKMRRFPANPRVSEGGCEVHFWLITRDMPLTCPSVEPVLLLKECTPRYRSSKLGTPRFVGCFDLQNGVFCPLLIPATCHFNGHLWLGKDLPEDRDIDIERSLRLNPMEVCNHCLLCTGSATPDTG